jgi:hypothetical protein
VRIAASSEIDASTVEKDSFGGPVSIGRIESRLRRLAGVRGVSFDCGLREIRVEFAGRYSELKKMEDELDSMHVSCEIIDPARVVIRPQEAVPLPHRAKEAVSRVQGVRAAEMDGNQLVVHADLSTLSLGGLLNEAERSGVKCRIVTHEELKVKFSGAGDSATLCAELDRIRGVIWIEVDSAEGAVRVVAVKGRLLTHALKSIMSKNGFSPAR